MNQTLANVTAFVRAAVNEPAPAQAAFSTWVCSGGLPGGEAGQLGQR